MIGFILSLVGIASLCCGCFVLGAICFALGSYEKIKDTSCEADAKAWLAMMKRKEN